MKNQWTKDTTWHNGTFTIIESVHGEFVLHQGDAVLGTYTNFPSASAAAFYVEHFGTVSPEEGCTCTHGNYVGIGHLDHEARYNSTWSVRVRHKNDRAKTLRTFNSATLPGAVKKFVSWAERNPF